MRPKQRHGPWSTAEQHRELSQSQCSLNMCSSSSSAPTLTRFSTTSQWNGAICTKADKCDKKASPRTFFVVVVINDARLRYHADVSSGGEGEGGGQRRNVSHLFSVLVLPAERSETSTGLTCCKHDREQWYVPLSHKKCKYAWIKISPVRTAG